MAIEVPPFGYRLMDVTEGTTVLQVPQSDHVTGPKRREGVPFYNPAMRKARDLSVLVLDALVAATDHPWRVCDAMAATGARGLRLAHEVPRVKVQLNDANPDAIQLAQANAKRLGLANVDFRVGRLESHLAAERYDWVDIDPFGTPAPFIDAAVLSVEDDGVLAITATDTAALSGVYPRVCERRYNARPRRGTCVPELTTRILLGAMARSAGRRDRGLRPLLAYAAHHYVRVYARLHGGPTAADQTLDQLGHAVFGPDLERRTQRGPGDPAQTAGPLWTGPLSDPALLLTMQQRASLHPGIARETLRLLERFMEEAAAAPLYYEIDELVRGRTGDLPTMEAWLERLHSRGHAAVRTHFSPRAIKTPATPDELLRSLERPHA